MRLSLGCRTQVLCLCGCALQKRLSSPLNFVFRFFISIAANDENNSAGVHYRVFRSGPSLHDDGGVSLRIRLMPVSKKKKKWSECGLGVEGLRKDTCRRARNFGTVFCASIHNRKVMIVSNF